MTPTDISVIICTRNRAASLRATLASVSQLKVPPGTTVEAFVVDNGSVDDTPAVIGAFTWPGVTVHPLRLEEPGLARSQNAAMRLARGRIIMFLDDDVRPPADWVSQLSAPIVAGEADAVGGGIAIVDDVKPAWLKPEHEEWLASTAHWEATRDPVLVGANMAIGRQVFDAIGGFDENLDHAIDTMFSYRLIAAGFRLVLRHEVAVEHWVEPARFTRAGMERQAAFRAELQAFVTHHWEHHRYSWPHLRWLQAKWRLARHRAGLGRLTDENLALPEMRLMQRVAFWPAYVRRRSEPFKYPAAGRKS